MEQNERYLNAKKQVEEERAFYHHLVAYVLVNGFLFGLNLFKYQGHWWFIWPLLGWGFGLASHGFSVFGKSRFWGKKWEEKRMRELMRDSD